jgi:anthranilate phosphoribosyltransferase
MSDRIPFFLLAKPAVESTGLGRFLLKLMRGENLTLTESEELLNEMLDGSSTDTQIAATLTALAVKGETVDEITGMARAMRSRATQINCTHTLFIDTAGTGASGAKTFNVSTAAAFVISGAGLAVAKHGNRALTSRSGSADVLTSLGVKIDVPVSTSEMCLNSTGICFMFAPLYHSATARVAGVRRDLGVRTTFNILGPLTNPAKAPLQIIGVFHRSLVAPMARCLLALGTKRAWVVHGSDGLDEITVAGNTAVAECYNGEVREFEISPKDFGLESSTVDGLRGADADANAKIIREILEGRRQDGARALVVANAAAALYIGDKAPDLKSAAKLAAESIDTGRALEKLEEFIKFTNR